VLAPNFLGRDFTVRNTAGAINHQAVALKVLGDMSAFWRCAIEGYQDTLYAHSNRQFYRESTISGTVDYIFGNAAAVFQSCTLLFRAPLPGQQNTLTAQGRTTDAQNTGLSFQNCLVDAAPDLQAVAPGSVQSYLGRPWKEYSRTVFLTNAVTAVLNPAGWLPWNGTFALATLFYGEYRNSGAGAATAARVPWATQIQDANVANQYTVNPFIMGAQWLPQTSVAYSPALYSN
jgi:pectinesterase